MAESKIETIESRSEAFTLKHNMLAQGGAIEFARDMDALPPFRIGSRYSRDIVLHSKKSVEKELS